jgi:hypothetical protein
MSLIINSQMFGKLEARMDDLREAVGDDDMALVKKTVERMAKAFAEVRGTASSGAAVPASEEAPAKGKKSRKTADGEPKVKREVKPGSWADQLKTVYMPVFNEAWKSQNGDEKKPAGILMRVSAYLKSQGKKEPTLEEMKAAITFFKENPDHKSETALSRSAGGSTDEAPKTRGRPKKKAAAVEKPVSAPVVVAKTEESDDEDSDEEEEEEEIPPLASFEYKGQNYLKDPFQQVYTSEGKPEWVGTFDGKKIKKGEMPAHVKKVLESME